MDAFRILLALHGPQAPSDLATELRARGWILDLTRNLADTWAAARRPGLDAVLLCPLSPHADDAELMSLLRLAAEPGGPALIVLTTEPARLESHAERLDDFLAPDDDADLVSRRLRFSIARKRALMRIHADRDELKATSTTDHKTGLRNDRYFDERCRIDSARSARDGRCLGLLMIDLDNFRELNRVHGHPFADRVLGEVGAVLARSIRPFDTAARVGGDEFAVLLPDANLRDVRRIGERLRTEIEALAMEREGQPAHVTVTVGAASWDPLRGESFEDVLKGTDRVLMAAKQAGRNRVETREARSGPDAVEAGRSA